VHIVDTQNNFFFRIYKRNFLHKVSSRVCGWGKFALPAKIRCWLI